MPSTATRECDIIMKGGVTSGVVYPPAVVALSQTYRFRNIGGTSAGAIASAVTAAAEFSRQSGGGTGFSGLAQLPAWLSANGHLFGLFKPNKPTRPIFEFLIRLVNSPKGQNRLLAALPALLVSSPFASLVGALIGIASIASDIALNQWWLVPFGLVLLLVLPFVLPIVPLFKCLANAVPGNYFGMCTGLDDSNPNDTTVLTSWLTQLIDTIAGVAGRTKPLTFGDLWTVGNAANLAAAAPSPDSQSDARDRQAERNARAINLEMITTNVTHGRPYRFPFDTKIFYFNPKDFEKLFPPKVVAWMVAHTRLPASDEETARVYSALPLLPLPEAADIPVVVAARMSLSFPLLISAVPLYAIDWSLPSNDQNKTAPKFERCWFSDGGLSSNFPIHLFDGPIPNRPTFAIDLQGFPQEQPENTTDQCQNIWMPSTNKQGLLDSWTRLNEDKPDLGGFVAAVLNAMQNWQDNTQSLVPGFRDRIVRVYLAGDEGGLNLNMPTAVLDKLAARGTCAGQRLIAHFDAVNPSSCGPGVAQPTNWDNHRVVRYRTAMALLENWLREFCTAYTPQYQVLVTRPLGNPPCSYPWENPFQQLYAAGATAALVTLSAGWTASGQTFADGAPRPQPELVTRPRY